MSALVLYTLRVSINGFYKNFINIFLRVDAYTANWKQGHFTEGHSVDSNKAQLTFFIAQQY